MLKLNKMWVILTYRGHAQGLPVLRVFLQEDREQAGTGEAKSQSAKEKEALDWQTECHLSGAIVGACEGSGYTTMQYSSLSHDRWVTGGQEGTPREVASRTDPVLAASLTTTSHVHKLEE